MHEAEAVQVIVCALPVAVAVSYLVTVWFWAAGALAEMVETLVT